MNHHAPKVWDRGGIYQDASLTTPFPLGNSFQFAPQALTPKSKLAASLSILGLTRPRTVLEATQTDPSRVQSSLSPQVR